MKQITENISYTEERALYRVQNADVRSSSFDVGESPFKHSERVDASDCLIKSRYPFWYAKDINADNCTFCEEARAGVWYTDGISVHNSVIHSPKNFRRSSGIRLKNVTFSNDPEALWECRDIEIDNVTVNGDYFAMNSQNMNIDNLQLIGKYSFDGVKNTVIRNSHLLTKDAFWNSENVTVYDSTVIGEYLGWNSKNLTLVNCTVQSLQGMCYIENLVMKSCRLVNTTLAFEYSSVEADICGSIDSVFNPKSGRIVADEISELILEPDRIDPKKTVIICRG